MTIKEIKEAMKEGKAVFGIKQLLKLIKKKKKPKKVFIAKDTREETKEKLKQLKIDFTMLKTKQAISKELGLNFVSEVISIL